MSTNDAAEQAFQEELQEILRRLIEEVNEEAAEIIEQALEPTRESHEMLLKSATKAESSLKTAKKVTSDLQNTQRELADVVKRSSSLEQQLQNLLTSFESRLMKLETGLTQKIEKQGEMAQKYLTGSIIEIGIVGFILFVTILANA